LEAKLPNKYFSLSEISNSIQSILRKTYSKGYWIKAEIAKLNYYEKSGHCYPDLVEKSESKILAQMRGIIWASDFLKITKIFKEVTGEELNEGMEVLFFCSVEYSPVHGLSLIISEISPEFTLGNMLAEKQKTIQKLIELEVIDKNKNLEFPRLPKRLAIISVATSKGYQDFKNVMDSNSKFGIYFHLFPALLQGDNAIKSITDQLLSILKVREYFDVVGIIRGGGGDIGLSCYDDFEMNQFIANYPLPVLTGIGHSTNQTVTELVSYRSFITPTELAYFILGRFEFENQLLNSFTQKFVLQANTILESNGNVIRHNAETITNWLKQFKQQNKISLANLEVGLRVASKNICNQNQHALRLLSEKIRLSNPYELLKKGYSITIHNDKIIKSISEISKGQRIKTLLSDGTIESEIIETK
jgi:exodeoxyribonuclease VII large subunit